MCPMSSAALALVAKARELTLAMKFKGGLRSVRAPLFPLQRVFF
jgi:hypothetical protein